MKRIHHFVLLLLLCFIGSHTSAQPINYSGKWILNLEKSKLETERAKKMTKGIFIIKQNENKVSLKRYHIFGKKVKKLSFKMVADGKPRRIKLLFKGKLGWIGNHLKATIWSKGFSNIVHYQFGDSQNELIADETFASSKKNYHNYWMFDRETNK